MVVNTYDEEKTFTANVTSENGKPVKSETHEITPLDVALVVLRISLSLCFISAASYFYEEAKAADQDGSSLDVTTLGLFGALFTLGIAFLFITAFLDLVKDTGVHLDIVKDTRENEPDESLPDESESKSYAENVAIHSCAMLGAMLWLIGTVGFFLFNRNYFIDIGTAMLFFGLQFFGVQFLIVSNLIRIARLGSSISLSMFFASLSLAIGNILFLCAITLIFFKVKELQGAICFLVGAVFYLVHCIFFLARELSFQRK